MKLQLQLQDCLNRFDEDLLSSFQWRDPYSTTGAGMVTPSGESSLLKMMLKNQG